MNRLFNNVCRQALSRKIPAKFYLRNLSGGVPPSIRIEKSNPRTTDASCSSPPSADVDEEDLEEMFVMGPKGMEWGGPTRGGKRPEPTRFGDWERKGRASDF